MTHIREYQKLNNSFRNELIYHIGVNAGFYSEFNNMILAIIYCIQNQIKFSIFSMDANFKYKEGWNDYFLPFCEENTDNFHLKYNTRYNDPFFNAHGIERVKILLYRMRHKHTYLTSDVFYKFRTTEFERTHFTFPQLNLDGDICTIAKEIIPLIYRFNEQTYTEISKNIHSLSLPTNFIGFHIRGGDKFVEHKLEECATYVKKAEQLSQLKEAFVLTDDYTIFETLQSEYPTWIFHTLTQPHERGYFHSEFQRKNAKEKSQDLIKLFSAMEILRKSNLFIGTLSSNPGMFLGMCMNNVHGVDIPNWTIW